MPTSVYSQAVFVTRHPAETPEEAMALKVPDVKLEYTTEMIDFYKRVREDDDDNKYLNMNVGALSVINMAGGICGAERLCKWMIKEPEVARRVLRLAADHQIATAQYCKDTFGVDRALPLGANAFASNQLISPKHFEEFALPVLKEVHEKILAMGFKHLLTHPCGEQNLNLPYWQQTSLGNPGIFWVGNEIDLETAAKFFPNDIIGGNLDTTVIQNGTPDEVYEAARKVIEQGRSLSTGFILIPACELPPLAPAENMRAIMRALNDFGWYS
jgi:uroporphyrinogen decarboxylase